MKFFILIILLIPILGTTQLLDNRKCNVFSDDNFFYEDFIKNNKIKKITGTISTKKSLQVIEQRNLVNTYLFDKQGRLEKQYRSFNYSTRKDTTFFTYFYNIDNQITTKRTSDSYGFFSNNYKYNKDGLMLSKSYCRDENIGTDKNHFKLGKQHVIVEETFSHQKTDSTAAIKTYNTHGKEYQLFTTFFNDLGFITKEEKKLIINKKKSIITYKYNDKGLVSEKTTFPNFNKKENTAQKYKYDEFGNLEYIDEYTNGKHITHNEIIYNKSTLLMKALLIQDIETNYIKIIKYKYEYW